MPEPARVRKLERALRRAAGRSRTLKQGYRWLAYRYRKLSLETARLRSRLGEGRVQGTGVRPENIIWIFGSGRSGSTWLRSMLEDLDRHQAWEEPMVGRLFGQFHDGALEVDLRRPDFVMADAAREGWIRGIRHFVLDCVGYARPSLGADGYLVVKEPNGSMGAPLLMEALPESRMIFLIRDPRDVAASSLDAARKGSWMYEVLDKATWRQKALADRKPDNFVRTRANSYLELIVSIKNAYNAHKGRKVLVRYEDLRADTLGTMKRIYSALEIPVEEEVLARAVEKHSWESIPKKEKGEGKFYRKGTPGGWREDLTPDQVKIVESITAPLFEEFYP